jgi:hypothetical protein
MILIGFAGLGFFGYRGAGRGRRFLDPESDPKFGNQARRTL